MNKTMISFSWSDIDRQRQMDVDGIDYLLRQLYAVRFLMSFHERIPRRVKSIIDKAIDEMERVKRGESSRS